jgi:hypothetical protein
MEARWDSKFELKPGRWVFVPSHDTIKSGAKIKDEILQRWKPPAYYYHLRKGGHVAALKAHSGKTCFIHVDIENFFHRINRSRVTRVLKGMYSYADSREIANFSTVRLPEDPNKTYVLPYGFVQSTVIASICLHKSAFGNFMRRLSLQHGIALSVYVDDIIISLDDKAEAEKIFDDIKSVAEKSGFSLNEKKMQGPASKINAFNIELSQNSLSVLPDRWHAFLDAMREDENPHRHQAILGYVGSVNLMQASQLQAAML